ncbi:rhomboid-related protein 4-like isoform X2 [Dreissena polymorpha]|uniref:rhomboid-related protein 4-like isoform X2 n=1 Tax=Dreissena polymorpha TaxID=45954 RepID=UPI002265289E|nr:rhomboid-related protein 4-like isoform X2 [Dreissena polymorpha]
MFRGGRHRGQNFGVLLLGMQLMNYGFDKIPPVTLVSIVGQTLIFLGIGDLDRMFGSVRDVCISTQLVVFQRQWKRLVLGALVHADDMHLYFNMASLLWKGSTLERRFKSPYFAYLLLVFTVLTSAVLCGLNYLMALVNEDPSYNLTCAVGFSGVLFALKVLTTHYSPPGMQYALGFIPVPSKYIYWAELGLIQLVYPNASFTGHLAGIVVGMLYIHGPLKFIMDSVMSPEASYTYFAGTANINRGYSGTTRENSYGAHEPRANHRRTEYRNDEPPHYGGQGQSSYDEYTGGLSEEEQLRRATEESRGQYYREPTAPPSERMYPDLDELRRRRADRYT